MALSLRAIHRPGISVPKFILSIILVVGSGLVAADVLYRGLEIDLGVQFTTQSGTFKIHPLVYLFGIAFLGYLGQTWLSQAYGGHKWIDLLLSIFALANIAIAVGVWADIPIFQWIIVNVTRILGYDLDIVETEYKVNAAVIFGSIALVDIIRDFLGIGRSWFRRDATVPTEVTDRGRIVHEFEHFYRNPTTGEEVPIANPSPALIQRGLKALAEAGVETTTTTTS